MVLFPYTALNEDELSLSEGQTVTIITKDVEDKVCCNLKFTAFWNLINPNIIIENRSKFYFHFCRVGGKVSWKEEWVCFRITL